jgi:serine/threonine-protein kinase
MPGNGLNSPRFVVGASGAVYVTDYDNNRVLRLATGSTTPSELPFTGLDNPDGVAVDASGAVYVADFQHNRVLRLAAGSTTPTVLPFTASPGPCGGGYRRRRVHRRLEH